MSDFETGDWIVDYVQVVEDENGEWRVRGRSEENGAIIWTTEQYGSHDWAMAVARDSGKPIRDAEGNALQ